MNKVVHTISYIGAKAGGTSTSVANLLKGMSCYDYKLLTFALDLGDVCLVDLDHTEMLEKPKNSFCYSPVYRKALENQHCDIYHTHGLWDYTTYITAKNAQKKGIPYVITPHGMLYPQALAKSKWIKKLFLKTYLLNDLQKAACIHATCEDELMHIRDLGIKAPIAVVPNSIELIETTKVVHKKRIGYVGRLHPRKQIDRLLLAWHKISDAYPEYEFVIVGDGDEEYLNFLKQECERLLVENVIFTGFLNGAVKNEMIQSFAFLLVPSDFENFGMIVAEALSLAVPVIASKGTPWEVLETRQCGWWIDNDVDTLAQTLDQALRLDEDERLRMGERGQKLIKENYSIETRFFENGIALYMDTRGR